MTCLYSWL